MHTPIGGREQTPPGLRVASGVIASAVVIADLWLVGHGDPSSMGLRAVPPMIALAWFLVLFRGDAAPIGLRWRPLPGLRSGIVATACIGAAIGAFIVIVAATSHGIGRPLPIYVTRPADLWAEFLGMCVLAPIAEEATFRFGLCNGAVPWLKPWGTIAVSGLAFGALHVLYGNAGPDNLIAGFVLAWAYLKSGTILVPVVLHSLGNFGVLLARSGAWYWLYGSA
jgi:membrane protease YdiL (CAAX protease family)